MPPNNYVMKKLFIILILISVLFVFLDIYNFLDIPQNFFYSITSPFQKLFIKISKSTNNFFDFLISLINLSSENKELKETNFRLLAENIYFKNLVKENKILREQLKIDSTNKFEALSAKL